jgi:Coenzyme PQQ synthesis protein D (PqqD)
MADELTDPAAVPQWRLEAQVRAMRGKMLVAGPEEIRELDEIATFIWRQIDGVRTVEQIAGIVSTEYDVDAGTALADVAELLAELASCRVIDLSAPGR